MGRQINYYLELTGFLPVAELALSLGCQIVQEDQRRGTVTVGQDLQLLTEDRGICCFFHLPSAGPLTVASLDGRERLCRSACPCENAVIEAGFSRILPGAKEITRARLFSSTGYYDSSGAFLPRPDAAAKVYRALVRLVKKLAPCSPLTDTYISSRDETYGQELSYTRKVYISPLCLRLRENEGYTLSM